MTRVRAEFIQIKKQKAILVVAGFSVLAGLYIAFQYVGNRNSGIYQPEVGSVASVAALVLWLFCGLFAAIPAVAVGGFLGAKDFQYNTAALAVTSSSRSLHVLSKLNAAFLLGFVVVCVTTVLALLMGYVTGASKAGGIDQNLLIQMGIATVVFGLTALFAFVISAILQSVVAGTVLTYLLILAPQFIGGKVLEICQWINPVSYFQTLLPQAFAQLSVFREVEVPEPQHSLGAAVSIGSMIVAANLIVIFAIIKKKEIR